MPTNLWALVTSLNLWGLSLRGSSMLSKLALVMLLSKYGSLKDLGVYGLFASSIVLLNYFQGIEFNRYTAREVITQDPANTTKMVMSQLFVHLTSYLLVLPLSLLVFEGGFLSWKYLTYFLWIAVFAHLGQEINRLLIIFANTTEAYLVSFSIHGLWACIVVIGFLLGQDSLALETIFRTWCFSSALGVLIGVCFLLKTRRFGGIGIGVDFVWIKAGLAISFKYFLGAIAIKLIELSDRYFIQFFHGEALVGAYTFYGSVANIVQEFVYTGVVVLLIPGLLSSYQNKEYEGYFEKTRRFKKSVWFFTSLISALVLIFMLLLLKFIERDLLSQNFTSFVLLVCACFVLNISLIPNYRLYLAGKDSVLMWSAMAGVGLNVILNLLLIPDMGMFGAALATMLSFSLVLVLNYWRAEKLARIV